jgi:hypothetical protein
VKRLDISEVVRLVGRTRPEPRGAELSKTRGAMRRTVLEEGHILAEERAKGTNMSALVQPRSSAYRTRQIIEEVRGNLLLLAPLAPRQEALVKQSLKLLRLVLGLARESAAPVAVPQAGSGDGR